MNDQYIGPVLPPNMRKAVDKESEDEPSCKGDIGPSLPPHLASRNDSNVIGPVFPSRSRKRTSSNSDDDSGVTIGPAMPPGYKKSRSDHSIETSIGPALPPHLVKKDSEDEDDSFGPVLPPGLKIKSSNSKETFTKCSIGPALPPHMQATSVCDDSDSYGPSLPPGFQTHDIMEDVNVVGPLPSEMTSVDVGRSAAADFEQRAQKMKDKLTVKEVEQPKQRESWMTELPTGMKKDLGLTARTFSRRTMSDKDRDTSAWTDTPADKARKEREREKHRDSEHRPKSSHSRHDKESKKQIDKHTKSKRGKSLLELHEKDRKKKKKKDKEKPKERLPFDRERDLQVNKFDDAQRRSIIKKSQQLNSRFSNAGSTSSFL